MAEEKGEHQRWVQEQKALDFLRLRVRAYQLAFPDAENNAVLKDLAKFCRAEATCFHPDQRLHALAEGRREVWLRIMDHLNLPLDEIYEKYTKPAIFQHQQKD